NRLHFTTGIAHGIEHAFTSLVEARVIKQIDEREPAARFEHTQRLDQTRGLVGHVAHLMERQAAHHAAESAIGERKPRRASVHELQARNPLELRVALGLDLGVLPVVAPIVESDELTGYRLRKADQELPAPAANVEQLAADS